MRRLTDKLTYANVISTICLFLLLGGGAAYAVSNLGNGVVGAKQLKKNAVTNAKIKANSVNGAKVKDNSLTGADINQSTLTAVRASNLTAISLSGDGNCTPTLPLPAGVSAQHTSPGTCKLTFPSSPANCTETATVHFRNLANNILLIAEERTAQISDAASLPNVLVVSTYQNNAKADLPFDMVMAC